MAVIQVNVFQGAIGDDVSCFLWGHGEVVELGPCRVLFKLLQGEERVGGERGMGGVSWSVLLTTSLPPPAPLLLLLLLLPLLLLLLLLLLLPYFHIIIIIITIIIINNNNNNNNTSSPS